MTRFLIPVVLLLIGAGAGIGGGIYLRPDPLADAPGNAPRQDAAAQAAPPDPAATDPVRRDAGDHTTAPARDYVRFNNQFIVPVIEEDRVASLVVLTLGVEVPAGQKETLYMMEPKVRDIFLAELFAHANRGGFGGTFTSSRNLNDLRNSLREAARYALGDLVSDILIIDIVRQDN